MTTYTLALRAQLDRIPTEDQALTIARTWATRTGFTLAMTSHYADEPALGVVGAVLDGDPAAAIETGMATLVDTLAEAGFTLSAWDAVELLSPAASQRRLEAGAIPPMVSTAELAEMCGVSTARIYELETERRKAADAGERHAFPKPVVQGWWLKTAAEHYASTRRRKPGPAPRRQNPLHANARAAGGAAS